MKLYSFAGGYGMGPATRARYACLGAQRSIFALRASTTLSLLREQGIRPQHYECVRSLGYDQQVPGHWEPAGIAAYKCKLLIINVFKVYRIRIAFC